MTRLLRKLNRRKMKAPQRLLAELDDVVADLFHMVACFPPPHQLPTEEPDELRHGLSAAWELLSLIGVTPEEIQIERIRYLIARPDEPAHALCFQSRDSHAAASHERLSSAPDVVTTNKEGAVSG